MAHSVTVMTKGVKPRERMLAVLSVKIFMLFRSKRNTDFSLKKNETTKIQEQP